MEDYSKLISKIKAKGEEIFWQGPVSNNQIELLEKELKVSLPNSFKEFLNIYGGGGVIDEEISGIENNDVNLKTGGTVLNDTIECRENFELPNYLIVIYYKFQELAWCLDTSQIDATKECPVVSFDLFSKKITNKIAENFQLFFKQYLELRADIDS